MGTTVIGVQSRMRRVKARVNFLLESKEATKGAKSEPASPSKPAKQDKEEGPKPDKSYLDQLAEDM